MSSISKAVRVASISLFAMTCLPSCGLVGSVTDAIDRTRQTTLAHFDQAILTLSQQSASWQTVLTQLESQLARDTQTTLANEVTQLAQRGIATAGTEISTVHGGVVRPNLENHHGR